ncbi:MAG: hypothetical protein JXR77_03925 [Lentisphaeria bacterium]|nr:hypothetical protein [Lentisphaeria bacterium]
MAGRYHLPVVLLLGLAPSGLSLWGATMIGSQSQNEGMVLVPAPAAVEIDGRLEEWDWSGRIWVFADTSVRGRYSVEVAGMWDKGNLYLAARWRDPTPLVNRIDPAFNPNDGWKSDCWQMRVRTDQCLWITAWQFTPRAQAVLHLDTWRDPNDSRGEHDVVLLAGTPGDPDLGRGARMAFALHPEGNGYTQELRLPWSLLFRELPDIAPGLTFRLGHEFLWGDVTGRTWPAHRYADNMQPGVTSREFFWSNWKAWGDATLRAEGNLEPRRYVDEAARLRGTIPVRVELPAGAARFTVVIETPDGRRLRNLAGDAEPENYSVAETPATRTVEVPWDGLDDRGRLVEPGQYTVRGLTHAGLTAQYEMCFYNPGAPPWDTQDGSGAWGADHHAPQCVARAGDWMAISWGFAEGGSGILGIDPEGRKRWGEKRGAHALAGDAEHVYAVVSSWHTRGRLCRFAAGDGSYRPFVLDGKPRPFELSLADIGLLPPETDARPVEEGEGTPAPAVTALAACGPELVLALGSGRVAVLEAGSAAVRRVLDVAGVTALAAGPRGRCWAIRDGSVVALALDTGAVEPLPTPGVGRPVALAVDGEGNIVVADGGPDSRVKAFAPDGRLVYTCGRAGGRPLRGTFDPGAMMRVSAVAVDARGRVWVSESWDYPRRVSVWDRSGALVRDYIGNTGYAGVGCFLHEHDPDTAFVGPIEIALNRAERTWHVRRILWVPDEQAGEGFPVATGSNTLPQRFESAASGALRQYLYQASQGVNTAHVVYMEGPGGWRPVAAVGLLGSISGQVQRYPEKIIEPPTGEFAGLSPYDGFFWSDTDGDGRLRRSECTLVPAQGGGRTRALPLDAGWGSRMSPDLSFYTAGLTRCRPLRFTAEGAPVYGPEGMQRFGPEDRGDTVEIAEEKLLLCLSHKDYPRRTSGMLGIDTDTGTVRWSYPNPYPGVHGSHNATMPKPGLIIGPLKILGVAEVNREAGRVFALRGNLGQDYFLTTDGLYVGALFQDGRLPGDSLPATEAELVGMPMAGFSHGSEPFNGWFGRQADGVLRETVGFARQAGMILRLGGLDTIRRFRAAPVTVSPALLVRAEADNATRAAAAATPKSCAVARVRTAPGLDAAGKNWPQAATLTIAREGRPEKASVQILRDDAGLYLLYDVDDATPWLNEGRDITRLFKTGDAVDLCLGPAHEGDSRRRDPGPGDLRIVIARLGDRPVAVLMRPVDPAAPREAGVTYHSPVMDRRFDRVAVLAEARLAAATRPGGYRIAVCIPFAALGIDPGPGTRLAGDAGVIWSDAQGRTNSARLCWSNPQTNLVSDLPHEAWLYPSLWGEFVLE